MQPIIVDELTGARLWRVPECAEHCGVSPATWRGYFRQGINLNPPAEVARLDARAPLWDAEAVKTWRASRPGSPVKNSPQAKQLHS
ncbi:hypothetical protein [uncultured Corynebacterium sp.]|uniref:hypothetical protein n=1 Tax=Corynebacterium TaxID=1716 RepID=UPI00210E1EA8|nr:hypothetical protein [uncultured Corynebacterium sp.]MCQ4611660.1 hypothetical protein [Corynebacterium sp. CCUG 51687]